MYYVYLYNLLVFYIYIIYDCDSPLLLGRDMFDRLFLLHNRYLKFSPPVLSRIYKTCRWCFNNEAE